MLNRLSIQNYAIIDALDIDFSRSLNIITGETGAGKSILVGALGLILGQRADSGVLLNRERKCIVEGTFSRETDEQVRTFLKEHELDVQEEVVVRREIAPNGKSRAFINDTPVNLAQLNGLSNLLVDLHQQFDTLELGESDFQREVLDALAGNFEALKKYRQLFEQLQNLKRKLNSLKEQKAQFTKEFDYYQFQYNELEDAGFKEDELENLEAELKLQTAAEGIKAALAKVYFDLEESEEPIVRKLKSLINTLQPYSGLHAGYSHHWQNDLQSAYIELQDIAAEAENIGNSANADAATIEQINERMSLGYKLLKKHGVKTTNELLQIKNELSEKLQAVLNIDEEIEKEEKKYNDVFAAS